MGMSASQARLLSLTARLSDLEFQAQGISNSKIRLADESAAASNSYELALDKQVLKVENGSDGSYQDANLNNVATYGGITIDGTNSHYRYITDSAGKLAMTSAQATALGATVVTNPNGTTTVSIAVPLNTFLTTNNAKKNSDGSWNTSDATYQYYNDLYAKLSTNQVTIISNDQAQDPEWLQNQVASGNLFLSEFNPTGGANGTGDFDQVSWTSGDNTMNEQTDSTQTARAEATYDATMADINAKDQRFDLELKTIDTEHEAIQTEIDSVKKVIDKNIERSFKIFQA